MSDVSTTTQIPIESRDPFWLTQVIGFLVLFLCSGFTFIVSSTLIVYFLHAASPQPLAFMLRLAAKAGVFAAVAGWSALQLRKLNSDMVFEPQPVAVPALPWVYAIIAALAAILLIIVVAFSKLDYYPHVEPDEAHHLIVARNIALHGVYGSGHPETGFVRFDEYDSVGPPVILPVAASIRAFGAGAVQARTVMAAFYILLTCLVYALYRPLFGPISAALAALFVFSMPGSVYLSRTLYGEVPALAFLLAGLLMWRQSFRRQAMLWCVGAGIAFGLMVLSKSFMLVTAFAFAGAWVYDRLTFRRIRAMHMIVPATTVLAILFIWTAVQDRAHAGDPTTAATQFGMYQHNLMFGFHSVLATTGWLMRFPLPLFAAIVCMVLFAPNVFVRRYDPSLVVLFLFVPFELFWWVFFTTGNIPRYVWYSLAMMAPYLAPLFTTALHRVVTRDAKKPAARVAWCAVAALVAIPTAVALARASNQAMTHDDTRDDRDLAAYVRALPNETKLATTFYPVQRIVNFFADRSIPRINKDSMGDYDEVVVDAESQSELLTGRIASKRIGRYAILPARQK